MNPECVAQERTQQAQHRATPEYRAHERKRAATLRQNPTWRARKNAQVRRAWRVMMQNPAYREQEHLRLRAIKQQPDYAVKLRKRYATDSGYALVQNMRCRIRAALHGKQKAARTLALLGVASIEQYKTYLEPQFQPGMTWQNYGIAWHVDHRIPLCTLDLSDPTNQQFLFNYKNTRPMWVKDNLSRSKIVTFEDLL